MKIKLSGELQSFVHDAVRVGCYATEQDVIRDALVRLRLAMPELSQTTDKNVCETGEDSEPDPDFSSAHRSHTSSQGIESTKSLPQTEKRPFTEAEIHHHMLKLGLLSQLPDSASDFDDPDDQPIIIQGEPLSETVIRERR